MPLRRPLFQNSGGCTRSPADRADLVLAIRAKGLLEGVTCACAPLRGKDVRRNKAAIMLRSLNSKRLRFESFMLSMTSASRGKEVERVKDSNTIGAHRSYNAPLS